MAKTNLQWAAVKICVWSSIAPPQKCEPPERLLFSRNEDFFLLTHHSYAVPLATGGALCP